MPVLPVFLAAAARPEDPSWWKLGGAFLLVFALLVLFLRLVGRLQRGAVAEDAALLRVQSLGPRRSLEYLRCGERVYTLYRSESSMALLEEEPYDPARHQPGADAPSLGGWLERLRALLKR